MRAADSGDVQHAHGPGYPGHAAHAPGVSHQPAPAGWHAQLKLGFTQTGARTVLTERAHSGPLRIQKPLYPEGDAVCHAIIVHPPGGIAANATLEWLPQEAIIFNAAQASSETALTLDEHALYLGWEVLCLGRTASGETFDTGRYRQRMTITRAGRLLWNERGTLDAGGRLMTSPIGLAGHSVAGTLLAAGRDIPQALLDAARAAVAKHAGATRIALTRMPHLLAARYLGDSSEEAKQLFARIWSVLRPALTAREAVRPRLWAT